MSFSLFDIPEKIQSINLLFVLMCDNAGWKRVSRKPDSSLSPQFPRKFIVINYSENSFDTSVHKLEYQYQESDFEWLQIMI